MKKTKQNRFLLAAQRAGSACINWPFPVCAKGYGKKYWKGKITRAHRVSLILQTGRDPDDLQAAHTCNNTSCVNPDHLYWATNQQNQDDKVADGGTGIVISDTAITMVKELIGHMSYIEIGKFVGCSAATVCHINKGYGRHE